MSQNGNLPGWESAFGKIVDDYSGGVFNPYWGPLGAMVFHGGGHAATYDNSVVILDLNDLSFKRLSDPSPSNHGANWNHQAADPALDAVHGEYGDGQPASAHTYDMLAILPPQDGGAAHGSLIRASSYALHVSESRSTSSAHRFDFPALSMSKGRWSRWSVNSLSALSSGGCSAYDTRRKRFWWIASLSSLPPFIRYLDVATRQQIQLNFSDPRTAAPAASPSSMTMRYDTSRDLLVMSCAVGDGVRFAYLRCAAPERGWSAVKLSLEIPVQAGASHPFDRVAEADKFVLLSPADPNAVYDIVVPPNPEDSWNVTRQAILGGPIEVAHVAGKRWSYAPAARSFVWMASSRSPVVAYRPVGV